MFPRHTPQSALAVALFLLYGGCALTTAQTQPPTEQPSASPPSSVKLNVIVVDSKNHPVDDARQEEFRVFEDGVEQKITYFATETGPVSYGLVIDNSGSLRAQLDSVIRAAQQIVDSNRPEDETFVMRFVDNKHIELVQDFTSNKERLGRALDDLYVQGGQTALIDAVYTATEHLAKNNKGGSEGSRRRVLVLITDGEDRASFYKQDQLFKRLREEGVQLFAIGLVNEVGQGNPRAPRNARERATEFLKRLAGETGGRAFFADSLSEMPRIVEEITHHLHTQYVIGYTPAAGSSSNSSSSRKPFRKIEVKMAETPGRDKRTATTRPGYDAPPK